jgi:hypothetical protein
MRVILDLFQASAGGKTAGQRWLVLKAGLVCVAVSGVIAQTERQVGQKLA